MVRGTITVAALAREVVLKMTNLSRVEWPLLLALQVFTTTLSVEKGRVTGNPYHTIRFA